MARLGELLNVKELVNVAAAFTDHLLTWCRTVPWSCSCLGAQRETKSKSSLPPQSELIPVSKRPNTRAIEIVLRALCEQIGTHSFNKHLSIYLVLSRAKEMVNNKA